MGIRLVLLVCCIVLSVKGSSYDADNDLPSNSFKIEIGGGNTRDTSNSEEDDAHILKKSNIGIEDVEEIDEGIGDSTEDSDEIRITTVLPETKLGEGEHVGPSRYKTDSPTVDVGDSPDSHSEPQQGALVNRDIKTAEPKSSDVRPEDDSEAGLNLADNNESAFHKKKRLHHTSAGPSVQLIILVVGAVCACVLITGFIRWRVRRRLNDRKFRKMSENLSSYRGRTGFPTTTTMDTIYECECEEVLDISRSHGRGVVNYSEGSPEEGGTGLDEASSPHSSHDTPSFTCSQFCSGGTRGLLLRSGSSDIAAEEEIAYRTKRQTSSQHKHHGHRSRYSRHHRRKSHDKAYTQRPDSISLENTSIAFDNKKIADCLTSLLEQGDSKGKEESSIEQQSSPVESKSATSFLLNENSPQHNRGILGSLVHTWRSLSFNREWVGRMWQEKHNVRRISDVLRGLTTTSNPDREDTIPEDSVVGDNTDNQFATAPYCTDSDFLRAAQVTEDSQSRSSTCATAPGSLYDTIEVTIFNEGETPGLLRNQNVSHGNSFPALGIDSSNNIIDSYIGTNTIGRSFEAEPNQAIRRDMSTGFLITSRSFEAEPSPVSRASMPNSFLTSSRSFEAEASPVLHASMPNSFLTSCQSFEAEPSPVSRAGMPNDFLTSCQSFEAEPIPASRAGMMTSFLSFSDQGDAPPGYDSLLESGSYSLSSLARSSTEHHRHHRRHRRKRTEHRERNIRHFYSQVHEDDHSSQADHASPALAHQQEEHAPLIIIHRPHDLPAEPIVESHVHDAATMTTPNYQSDAGHGQNKSTNIFTNSTTNQNVSPKTAPFMPQEGIIIEQLSDGGQIIYIPPPALPSYHNDTPPPYKK